MHCVGLYAICIFKGTFPVDLLYKHITDMIFLCLLKSRTNFLLRSTAVLTLNYNTQEALEVTINALMPNIPLEEAGILILAAT